MLPLEINYFYGAELKSPISELPHSNRTFGRLLLEDADYPIHNRSLTAQGKKTGTGMLNPTGLTARTL